MWLGFFKVDLSAVNRGWLHQPNQPRTVLTTGFKRPQSSKLLCNTWLRSTGARQGRSQNIICAVLTHWHRAISDSKPCSRKEKLDVRKRVGEDRSECKMHLRISPAAFPGSFQWSSNCSPIFHLVQGRADSIYNVFKTTEWVVSPALDTCTVPVGSIKELPSTQGASLLEEL